MKKVMLILIIAGAMTTSCEKMGEKDNHCPVLPESAVPAVVTHAFYGDPILDSNGMQTGYTNNNPTRILGWFNKDNTGYCVIFLDMNGAKNSNLYDNAGALTKSGLYIEDDNESDDGFFSQFKKKSKRSATDTSCECEVEGDDHD